MASTRLLCNNRNFLNQFSSYIDGHQQPKRTLWISNTFFDKNGVSNTLQLTLSEIQKKDCAIDFLICHPDAVAEEHLHVIRPLSSFTMNNLGEQVFHVPDIFHQVKKNTFHQTGHCWQWISG